jgi:hypothetical protein
MDPREPISGVVKDESGNPISGVLVYLVDCVDPQGCGTAITDEQGRFSFTRVRLTESVRIAVQKTGVEFEDPNPSLAPGESPVIEGRLVEFNQDMCEERPNSDAIHGAAEVSQDLLDLVKEAAQKLPVSFSTGEDGKRGGRARTMARIAQQLQRYLELSKKIPEITLSRCLGSSCAQVTHRDSLRLMRKAIKQLSNMGYAASKVLYERRVMSLFQRDMFDCRVRKLHISVLKSLRLLPTSTVMCESALPG